MPTHRTAQITVAPKDMIMLTSRRLSNFHRIINIPIIVLVELLHLIEKNKIEQSFDDMMAFFDDNLAYKIIPIEISLIKNLEKYKDFIILVPI